MLAYLLLNPMSDIYYFVYKCDIIMQRVNLGKPYEEYIKRMVKGGYFASASEVLRML